MGPFVVMLFWATVLTPVGLLLGALVSFVGIPLFLKLRRSRGTDRHVGYLPRFALMFLICAVFVSVMACLGGWLMEKDSGDYWKSKGDWDVWRMPLEYPYYLLAVGSLDEGTIAHWQTRSQPVHGITRFYKSGNIVVGQGAWRFFSFDCRSGQVVWYSEEEYRQALTELGFEKEPDLLTVEENIDLYWNSH